MIYINKGEYYNPHELPKENSEGFLNADNAVNTHTKSTTTLPEEIEKLEYIYQHFQDCGKIHEIDPHLPTEQIDDTVYPQINNDIKYSLFENIIDSYFLDSQIEMTLHVPKLVIHIIMITTYLTQDHSVHTHMNTYHNNLTH